MSSPERDVLCLACGRRGPWVVIYLRDNPAGGQRQAMGLCPKAGCAQAYEEHK